MGRRHGRRAEALRQKKLGSLAALLERHGGAVRADLRRFYGLSLGEMFSGEVTPDEVWDCILHLPRNCATWSAVFDDPDTVTGDEQAEMKLAEYSPEVEAIADLYDLTASLLAHVSAFTAKTPVKIPPHRRPGEARRKAAQEARRAQARREWSEILGKLGIPE